MHCSAVSPILLSRVADIEQYTDYFVPSWCACKICVKYKMKAVLSSEEEGVELV